ncbi:apolipoprotein N-acyltransferase [Enemella sp. A6]|uniref:apolipoprotein N-acyltransferase n=1 Tax=Enemella sp. A6 TaxID=3440152 RepID=UPI003EBAEDC3
MIGLPGPLRILAAAAAGVLTAVAFEPYGLWFLAPFTVALFGALTSQVRLPLAAVTGFAYGAGLWGLGIEWLVVFTAPALIGVVCLEALFFALLGMAVNRIQPRAAIGKTPARPGLPGWPVWLAAAWSACEFWFSRQPWGGFPWMRLGFTSVESPYGGWLPLLGVAGVGFLITLTGTTLLWLVRRAPARPKLAVVIAVGLVAMLAVGQGLRVWTPGLPPGDERVNVAVVQGNVFGVGINAMGRARSMPNNHLAETTKLMARAHAGQVPMPDLVVWPESSTDADPTRDARTRASVQAATEVSGLPVLVGAVMDGPGEGERQTSVLWWDPEDGIVDRYDKQDLVPFGEWIPMREVFLPLVPMLAAVGKQSVPGTEPGLISGQLNDGRQILVGDVLCYELAYDDTVATMFGGDPDIVVVQSNNSMYGYSGQIEQQFAITRARAMEGRREIAVSTTSGVSGLIDPLGRVLDRTEEFTADHRVYELHSGPVRTPAGKLAGPVSMGLMLLGLGATLVALVIRPRVRTVAAGEHDGTNPETKEEQ